MFSGFAHHWVGILGGGKLHLQHKVETSHHRGGVYGPPFMVVLSTIFCNSVSKPAAGDTYRPKYKVKSWSTVCFYHDWLSVVVDHGMRQKAKQRLERLSEACSAASRRQPTRYSEYHQAYEYDVTTRTADN